MKSEIFELADFIIEAMKVPRTLARENKFGRPLDLSHKRKELAQLIAEAHDSYALALDDWEVRMAPDKPRKILEENWRAEDESTPHDYSAWHDEGDANAEWAKHWKAFYSLPRGNPGRGRYNAAVSVTALRTVYIAVRRWWKLHVGKPFTGDFNFKEATIRERTLNYFAPGAKLFYMIAHYIDARYTPSHCHWVHDDLRKKIRL